MKIGILREHKSPPDLRAPLTPAQCKRLQEQYPFLKIAVESCMNRAFTDEEYRQQGAEITADLSGCDMLLGIKEVPPEKLIPEKKYLFFSHTIKKQPHNRGMLRAILNKRIELIDYECLVNREGFRLVGFGHFAGIAGAYNGIMAYGLLHGLFWLERAYLLRDRHELFRRLVKVKIPPLKITLTGEGRVAQGAMEILDALAIKKVLPKDYLNNAFETPVYCQLGVTDYNRRKDDKPADMHDFFRHPERYESAFGPYTKASDLYIACHFWDPRAPRIFTKEEMHSPDFRIRIIADVSCDVNGSVPSTIMSSTIESPFYGYNPVTEQADAPFSARCITVMAVDNLPNELPRDASEEFGEQLIQSVFPHLIEGDKEGIIEGATITRAGKLTEKFSYLSDYAGVIL